MGFAAEPTRQTGMVLSPESRTYGGAAMSAKGTKYKAAVRKDKSGIHVDVLAEDVGEVMNLVRGSSSAQISVTHWRLTFPQGANLSDIKTILRRFDELSRTPAPVSRPLS
jgi:hypothetical protein